MLASLSAPAESKAAGWLLQREAYMLSSRCEGPQLPAPSLPCEPRVGCRVFVTTETVASPLHPEEVPDNGGLLLVLRHFSGLQQTNFQIDTC